MLEPSTNQFFAATPVRAQPTTSPGVLASPLCLMTGGPACAGTGVLRCPMLLGFQNSRRDGREELEVDGPLLTVAVCSAGELCRYRRWA